MVEEQWCNFLIDVCKTPFYGVAEVYNCDWFSRGWQENSLRKSQQKNNLFIMDSYCIILLPDMHWNSWIWLVIAYCFWSLIVLLASHFYKTSFSTWWLLLWFLDFGRSRDQNGSHSSVISREFRWWLENGDSLRGRHDMNTLSTWLPIRSVSYAFLTQKVSKLDLWWLLCFG